jgi:hypothetical protein
MFDSNPSQPGWRFVRSRFTLVRTLGLGREVWRKPGFAFPGKRYDNLAFRRVGKSPE